MLDFAAVREQKITFEQLVANLTVADLHTLTDEMVDTMLAMIADSVDADVIFEPADPGAHDSYATNSAEVDIAWTLGHLIVHTTASAEESAALAAEMARGVPNHGRSRSEEPWRSVTTIAACRARLEESRRMRHASLHMWPDLPHLELSYQPRPGAAEINAIGRFVFGLRHEDSHLGQIEEVVRQARLVRVAV